MSCKDVLPKPDFPKLLVFGENQEYIRNIILSADLTSVLEGYEDINKLDDNHRFFTSNKAFIGNEETTPSHMVIEKHIKKFNKDYRYEIAPHPLEELRNRKADNMCVGRCKSE